MPYKIKQHSYTILDTSEGQVFLHVNHEGDGAKWGNVYQSDGLGLNYTLSLPHNRRDAHGKVRVLIGGGHARVVRLYSVE
jgi:hypothetical protein